MVALIREKYEFWCEMTSCAFLNVTHCMKEQNKEEKLGFLTYSDVFG